MNAVVETIPRPRAPSKLTVATYRAAERNNEM